jgi:hypothetical protein
VSGPSICQSSNLVVAHRAKHLARRQCNEYLAVRCQLKVGAWGWHSRPFSGFGQRAGLQDLSIANQLGEDVDLRRQTGANDYDTECVFLFTHIRESEEARPSEVV